MIGEKGSVRVGPRRTNRRPPAMASSPPPGDRGLRRLARRSNAAGGGRPGASRMERDCSSRRWWEPPGSASRDRQATAPAVVARTLLGSGGFSTSDRENSTVPAIVMVCLPTGSR